MSEDNGVKIEPEKAQRLLMVDVNKQNEGPESLWPRDTCCVRLPEDHLLSL